MGVSNYDWHNQHKLEYFNLRGVRPWATPLFIMGGVYSMNNKTAYDKIARLRTTDLMITKMDCMLRMSFHRNLKQGALGILVVIFGRLIKVVFEEQSLFAYLI